MSERLSFGCTVSVVLNLYRFRDPATFSEPRFTPDLRRKFKQKHNSGSDDGPTELVAQSLPKEENRTRRVDKGKSGQALKTAVSGGFGGGILSQIDKASGDSCGGTEPRLLRSR